MDPVAVHPAGQPQQAPDVGRVLGISKQRVYQIEKIADEGKKVAGQKVAGQKVAS